MKVVIYHAKAKLADKFAANTYERLIEGLRKNVNELGFPLVHLTIEGEPGFGDENYFYSGNPEYIVWNRERLFLEFLKQAPDDVYWFSEPDYRIVNMFPELTADLALLRRNDKVAITPSWRLATKAAIPFFEEVLSYYPDDDELRAWDGDSDAYIQIWKAMGQPNIGMLRYNNMSIELRDYSAYCKPRSKFTAQWKAHNKDDLLKQEYGVNYGSR